MAEAVAVADRGRLAVASAMANRAHFQRPLTASEPPPPSHPPTPALTAIKPASASATAIKHGVRLRACHRVRNLYMQAAPNCWALQMSHLDQN